MICVDLWAPQAPREIAGAETYDDWQHEDHYGKFVQFAAQHFPGRADIMRMSTHDASRFVPDDSLDFVFIDADHSYEGCKQDIEDWACKVRKGGLVSGHDLNWPTVKQAVEEKYPQYVVFNDNVWAVQV